MLLGMGVRTVFFDNVMALDFLVAALQAARSHRPADHVVLGFFNGKRPNVISGLQRPSGDRAGVRVPYRWVDPTSNCKLGASREADLTDEKSTERQVWWLVQARTKFQEPRERDCSPNWS